MICVVFHVNSGKLNDVTHYAPHQWCWPIFLPCTFGIYPLLPDSVVPVHRLFSPATSLARCWLSTNCKRQLRTPSLLRQQRWQLPPTNASSNASKLLRWWQVRPPRVHFSDCSRWHPLEPRQYSKLHTRLLLTISTINDAYLPSPDNRLSDSIRCPQIRISGCCGWHVTGG